MTRRILLTATAIACIGFASAAAARDQIEIVGSSTVYPFALDVAKSFVAETGLAEPNIVSTGSGGGINAFCEGVGEGFADITNASRRMKASELETCIANGVTEVIEVEFGYDGIVLVNAAGGPELAITRAQLTTALAAQGPMPAKWSDIDGSLPDIPIKVLGPSEVEGTRDSFIELVLEEGCEGAGIPCDGIELRGDGAWTDYGVSAEAHYELVASLPDNPETYAILGFSYLDQNRGKLQGAVVEGIEPSFDNVAGQEYPISRSLFFYIKKAHVDMVPGIKDFAMQFLVGAYDGPEGYLIESGVVPVTEIRYFEVMDAVDAMMPISAGDLQ